MGLDAGGPLHCEVEALGERLEDVRETLSTLADTVDARVLNQELARGDLCQTKNFLDSVQQVRALLPLTDCVPSLPLGHSVVVVDVLSRWRRNRG